LIIKINKTEAANKPLNKIMSIDEKDRNLEKRAVPPKEKPICVKSKDK